MKKLKNMPGKTLIAIKGAGDLASGVAHRLSRSGFAVLMTELEKPTAIRRTVAFSQAIYDGEMTLEGVRARRADLDNWAEILAEGLVAVLPGVDQAWLDRLEAAALVEATLSKRNTGLQKKEGRCTLALGPGYLAGLDVDAVVETARGHFLGRLILEGAALPNTGRPGLIGGEDWDRVIRSPAAGPATFSASIGQAVVRGQILGRVGQTEILAPIGGILRGTLPDGLTVQEGFKIGDVDPRPEAAAFIHSPSDKARAVAGGVLEGLLYFGLRP